MSRRDLYGRAVNAVVEDPKLEEFGEGFEARGRREGMLVGFREAVVRYFELIGTV